MNSTTCPATIRSEHVSERAEGDLSPEPPKKTKAKKNGDSKLARIDLLPELPKWLQEFIENLVGERVPEYGDAPASSSRESTTEPVRKEVPGKHCIKTHFPKDRNYEIRTRTKTTRAPCRKRTGEAIHRAENFGELITADQKVLSEGCESRNNHRYAVVVEDLATQWTQSYPCKTKTSQETDKSLHKFLEPSEKSKVICTDSSLEFGKDREELFWNHWTSTHHRSETKGIPERAVRRIEEGISAVLLQSGLDEKWWVDSMECYCYLRNIQDLLSDGRTPYERRFGESLKGPIIAFGSLSEHRTISAKDLSRLHQFGKKVLPGIFLRYVLYAGGNLERRPTGRRH